MTDRTPQPTLNQLLMWRDHLKGKFGQFIAEVESEEDLYFQIFDLESPGGALTVKTGSAPADVDAAVDTLVPVSVDVRVPPALGKKKYEEQADKLVMGARGLDRAWRRKHDVVREVVTDQAMRRVGIARVLLDRNRFPNRPESLQRKEKPLPPVLAEEMTDDQITDYKLQVAAWESHEDQVDAWELEHRKDLPIILERRDPRFCFWKRSTVTHELMIVVEHYKTSVLEAKETYGNWVRAADYLNGLQDQDEVWISDIWYGRWRCLLIDDQPIFPIKMGTEYDGIGLHNYAKIPYAIAPFREIPHEDVEKRYRGMLTNAAGLYPMESQVLTMHVWMLAWNSWRTFKGHLSDGRKLRVIPGEFIEINPLKGESLDLMGGDPVPEALMNTAQLFDSYIQRNGVAQGPRQSEGTRSAAQLWAIQAQRQLKIEAAKQSLARFYEQIFHLAMLIIEFNLNDESLTIPVVGKDKDGEDLGVVKLSKKIIGGYDDAFDVNFGTRLDPATLEQAKTLMEMAINRWMPFEESWRLAGLTEYPQEWSKMLYREGVERMPMIMMALAFQALVEEFRDDPENGPGVQGGIVELFRQQMASAQASQANPMEPAGLTPAAGHGGGEGGGEANPAQQLHQETEPRTSARPTGRPPARRNGARPVAAGA